MKLIGKSVRGSQTATLFRFETEKDAVNGFSKMQYSITLISLLALVSAEKPRFTRFFNIVFENTDLVVASELSYFKELASKGRLYANMHGVAHPSQPNYIAMVAGTTFGFLSDDNIDIPGSNLADLLEARHLTWKTYQENYPGNCYIGKGLNDLYERKHNPFMSFDNVSLTS